MTRRLFYRTSWKTAHGNSSSDRKVILPHLQNKYATSLRKAIQKQKDLVKSFSEDQWLDSSLYIKTCLLRETSLNPLTAPSIRGL